MDETLSDHEAVWDVYQTGEHRVVDDAGGVDRESPVQSALVLPLGAHGVFIASSPESRRFEDETVQFARLLAAITEAALSRARNIGAVRERERELRALFENIPVPAVSVDYHDDVPVVLEVNSAFEERFGYDAEEMVGENIDEYVVPENQMDEASSITSRASSGQSLSMEVTRQTADGLRDFLLTTAPVEPGAEDARVYGFYIDISERQQRQQRLQVLSRVLRHDIRNQVTLVQGSAEQIAERASDPSVEQAASDIAKAAGELARIGQKTRIVERTQVDSGPGEVSTVGRIVEGVVGPVRESSPDARIAVDVPQDARIAGAEALGLALREVVENAIVHSEAAEPQVRIAGRTTDERFLELEVNDDGPGLREEELAVLTGRQEPTQLEHASGLGLWIAKWITGGLGGEIDIRASEETGTVVEFRVPLAPTDG
jgi:PAS domain S-box-containing protein